LDDSDGTPDVRDPALDPDADDVTLEQLTLTPDTPPELAAALAKHQFIVALVSVILGTIVIIFGAVMCILGFAGTVSWKITGLGLSSNVQTGTLGIIIALIGLLIIYFNRYNVAVVSAPLKRKKK
jgi:hypothetical protein